MKILKSNFLSKKIYQYGLTVYQKMQNSNIWGVCFLLKKLFFQYFHEKIMIYDF